MKQWIYGIVDYTWSDLTWSDWQLLDAFAAFQGKTLWMKKIKHLWNIPRWKHTGYAGGVHEPHSAGFPPHCGLRPNLQVAKQFSVQWDRVMSFNDFFRICYISGNTKQYKASINCHIDLIWCVCWIHKRISETPPIHKTEHSEEEVTTQEKFCEHL